MTTTPETSTCWLHILTHNAAWCLAEAEVKLQVYTVQPRKFMTLRLDAIGSQPVRNLCFDSTGGKAKNTKQKLLLVSNRMSVSHRMAPFSAVTFGG